MSTFLDPQFFRQGDHDPRLVILLRTPTGGTVDSSTASSVEVVWRRIGDTTIHRRTATATAATLGEYVYRFVDGETDTLGVYLFHALVHWPDGTTRSFPAGDAGRFVVVSNLFSGLEVLVGAAQMHSTSTQSIPVGSALTKIAFDVLDFNRGASLTPDLTLDQFTVVEEGAYLAVGQVLTDAGANFTVELFVNGAQHTGALGAGGDAAVPCIGLAQLAVGDVVTLRAKHDDGAMAHNVTFAYLGLAKLTS